MTEPLFTIEEVLTTKEPVDVELAAIEEHFRPIPHGVEDIMSSIQRLQSEDDQALILQQGAEHSPDLASQAISMSSTGIDPNLSLLSDRRPRLSGIQTFDESNAKFVEHGIHEDEDLPRAVTVQVTDDARKSLSPTGVAYGSLPAVHNYHDLTSIEEDSVSSEDDSTDSCLPAGQQRPNYAHPLNRRSNRTILDNRYRPVNRMSTGWSSLASSVGRWTIPTTERRLRLSIFGSVRTIRDKLFDAEKYKLNAIVKSVVPSPDPTLIDTQLTINCPRSDVVLKRRKCCYPWTGQRLISCEQCGLSGLHCIAINPALGLGLQNVEKYDYTAVDRFNLSVLHYVATRPVKILAGLEHFCAHGAKLSALNRDEQNFLFALNPAGLDAKSEDILRLLEFVASEDFNFDFWHQDTHGQTFLHCLLRREWHCESLPLPQLIRVIAFVGSDIMSIPDNFGETISTLIPQKYLFLRQHLGQAITYGPYNSGIAYEAASGLISFEYLGRSTRGSLTDTPPAHLYDASGWTPLLIRIESVALTGARSAADAQVAEDINYGPFCSATSTYVQMRDREGNSPVHLAVKYGMPRTLAALINAGARCDVLNYAGESVTDAMYKQLKHLRAIDSSASVLKEADLYTCGIFLTRRYLNQSLFFQFRPRKAEVDKTLLHIFDGTNDRKISCDLAKSLAGDC